MFEGLDEIPWNRLEHAYGLAIDAPAWIRGLGSEDADVRSDAVYHFLLSSAFHQYTLYSATPYVIPFVLEALRNAEISQRSVFDSGEPLMKTEMLDFLRACARAANRNDPVELALLQGRDVYAMYADDADAQTRDHAAELLVFCNDRATRAT